MLIATPNRGDTRMLSWGTPKVDPDAQTRSDHSAVGDDGETTDYSEYHEGRRARGKRLVYGFLLFLFALITTAAMAVVCSGT